MNGALLGALGRLARRRTLAASTRALLLDVALVSAVEAVGPLVARVRPIAGSRAWAGGGRMTARCGGRRWYVAGPANEPVHVHREEHRRAVEVALGGVEAAELPATAVLDTLRPGTGDEPWYLTWKERDRERTWALGSGGPRPPDGLLAAPAWRLWRAYRMPGGRPSGNESATTVRLNRGPTAPMTEVGHPIDVVYTWVDDADPAWQEARRACRRSLGQPATSADDAARFRQHDELRYSLRSLWHHASWIRRIHLVTSGQVPTWLQEDDRLRVVRHEELLPTDALPTFNSHAIESALHNIDGLAEHFVYLNDDMLVHRPLEPTTFFEPGSSARPRVFLDDAAPPDGDDHPPGMYRAAARTNAIVRRLTGHDDRRMVRHAPYALTRSLLDELHQLLPDELDAVAHERFRARDDVSLAASLAPKYALATGRAIEARLDVEYVGLGHVLAGLRLRRLALLDRFDVSCLNTTDADPPEGPDGRSLTRWMERLAPVPSPWE